MLVWLGELLVLVPVGVFVTLLAGTPYKFRRSVRIQKNQITRPPSRFPPRSLPTYSYRDGLAGHFDILVVHHLEYNRGWYTRAEVYCPCASGVRPGVFEMILRQLGIGVPRSKLWKTKS